MENNKHKDITRELADRKAREKISNIMEESFFVEAGAGSGKTYCLVDRMVNLIKKGAANIENISAVTFTRKAAAELSERFQIKLEENLKSSATGNERKNILLALSNLEQIFIGTIHSFCSKLLRERPVEAGVDPGFEEIDQAEDKTYAETAWSRFIEAERISENNIFDFMDEIGISTGDIKESFMRLVKYPDVEIAAKDVKKPDFSIVNKSIVDFIGFFDDKIPTHEPGKEWDDLQKIIIKTRNYINSGFLKEGRLLPVLLKQISKKPGITQNRWPDGSAKDYQEMIIDFQESVISPALTGWHEYIYKPLIDFAKKGSEFYEDWRKEHSILNFEDLLMKTAKLLKDNKEVRQYFKEKFTHILVDEFQDTDPIQAEIILLLTGGSDNENDWRKLFPEPGALFVVGDPKQSIYRFRRADIDIYNMVKDKFSHDGCGVLELNSNFRSLPFMEGIVDKTFKSVFPEKETKYQAKYFSLNTIRNQKGEFNSGIMENPIKKIGGNNAGRVAEEDAKRISIWIREAISGDIKLQRTEGEIKQELTEKAEYSDFLILTKGKKHLNSYAEALELQGIPYDISGSESFGSSEELKEIYTLFMAIEDERDPVSLIAALRGLFFGISDDMLYKFKKAGGWFSYFSKVPDEHSEISEAFSRLKEYKEIIKTHTPQVAAEIIIEKLGIIPLALSEDNGVAKAGNIFKALQLIKGFKEDAIGTFSDFNAGLGGLLDSKDIESKNIVLSNKNAVRIMNLHKAKGLESPVVILADPLGEIKQWDPELHITRTEGNKAKGYFAIVKKNGNYGLEIISFPKGWKEKSEEEKKYADAERHRLEYVAVTRAKNILVVSTYREGSRAKAWEFLYDYLSDAPEIEVKDKVEATGREAFSISKNKWQIKQKKIAKSLEDIGEDSYRLINVATEAKEGVIFSEGIAGGMGWGRIVHKAVEMVCRGGYKKLKAVAGKWLEEEGKPKDDTIRLISLIDKFMKSDLWKRIESAEEKYFEVPFALSEAGSIVHGVIDLVFKEAGEWVIVDYKTDDFEGDKERKKAYEKQIKLYKKYWEMISKEKVKETSLYKL